jgi:hypothetical protein
MTRCSITSLNGKAAKFQARRLPVNKNFPDQKEISRCHQTPQMFDLYLFLPVSATFMR